MNQKETNEDSKRVEKKENGETKQRAKTIQKKSRDERKNRTAVEIKERD